MNVVPLDMSQVKVDPAVALAVPASLALRRRLLPFARVDGEVYIACANPADTSALRAAQRYLGEPVRGHSAEPASLQQALERTYGDGAGRETTGLLRKPAGPGRGAEPAALEGDDATALCDELLRAAILRQASDVHVDPERESVRVRFRVDGVLEDYARLPREALASVLSRFKVLSGMDIAEKRAPQDGRFTHEYGAGKAVELRTATLPTKFGERMTLRLLALQTESLTLERLGMADDQLELFDRQLRRPHGLLLVTGPTGSGKSTTLYAALRRLIAERPLNAITVEDPIEFDIAGVAQVEVDAADKVGFGRALRSILRHDPDVIMIGEVRDAESASVAVKASLTGHLVLSTLHTNSAPGALTRLHDMGVERYLIAATARLCVAQRLVRRLCARCRRARPLSEAEAALLGRLPEAAGETIYEPGGCLYCANRGYAGRLGLFELLPIEPALSERIVAGAGEGELLTAMRAAKLPTLAERAYEAARAGLTSLDEAVTAVAAG